MKGLGAMDLYRVVYCSRNGISGDREDLARQIDLILRASRRNNQRDGITGGLLFSNGCFAQVLEGPAMVVEEAFERIQCDERHSDVTVLESGPIAERAFPGWSMAFAGAEDEPLIGNSLADPLSGFTNVGFEVLQVLKATIVHEDAWLGDGAQVAA